MDKIKNKITGRKKHLLVGGTGALLIAVLLFWQLSPAVSAAVTIGTSNDVGGASATTNTQQRKVFYDTTNNLYWAFFSDGVFGEIKYTNSSNGSSWSSAVTVDVGVSGLLSGDFSVWYDSTSTVYFVYDPGASNLQVWKGTLGGSSITWIDQSGLVGGVAATQPNISQDSNGKIWVSWKDSTAIGVRAARSSSANNISAFDSAIVVEAGASNNVRESISMAPLTTSGDMIIAWTHNALGTTMNFKSRIWDDSASGLGTTTTIGSKAINGAIGGTNSRLSLVAGASDAAHIVYQSIETSPGGEGDILYSYYSGGAWGTPITIEAADSRYATISIDSAHSDKLYAFYITGNTINYKTGVSPYGSGNWDASPTSLIATGTNSYTTSVYKQGGNKIPVIWSDGSGSAFDVKFDSIALNSAPATPTHTGTSPGNGSTVASTSQTFQVTTTDPDSDSLKYHIKIFNGTGQSGGLCTGSVFEQQDGTSGQGAWSASSYSSGATASYTNASALTRGNSYCWQVRANDFGGSATWSGWSTPWTFTVNSIPSAPTLLEPSSGQAGILAQPYLRLAATDTDSDYLKYYIKFCGTDSSCTTYTHLICQEDSGSGIPIACTESQTGWTSQNQQSNTAYSSGQTAVHKYQYADLVSNTTYYWRAYVVDPGGSNTWSSASSIFSFTTANASTSHDIEFRGGTCFGAC